MVSKWEASGDHPAPLTERDVQAVLADAKGLVGLLAKANRIDRSALYQAPRRLAPRHRAAVRK